MYPTIFVLFCVVLQINNRIQKKVENDTLLRFLIFEKKINLKKGVK